MTIDGLDGKLGREITQAFIASQASWDLIEHDTKTSDFLFWTAAMRVMTEKPLRDPVVQQQVLDFLNHKLTQTAETLTSSALEKIKQLIQED
jgi:hypothetical protein